MKETPTTSSLPTTYPLLSPRRARNTFRGRFISISQVSAARVCRFFMKFLGGFTLKSSVEFNTHTLYLFASNHQSRWDPFAIFGVPPLSHTARAAPIKFMTARGLYYSPLRPILAGIGCYPTRIRNKDIIEYSAAMMQHDYNLFIFPEGRRSLPQESAPRQGVSQLIELTAQYNPKLILIHIDWHRLGRVRRHATITVAEAPQGLDTTNPKAIMDAIYSL